MLRYIFQFIIVSLLFIGFHTSLSAQKIADKHKMRVELYEYIYSKIGDDEAKYYQVKLKAYELLESGKRVFTPTQMKAYQQKVKKDLRGDISSPKNKEAYQEKMEKVILVDDLM